MKNINKILISGEGGQGIQLISKCLAVSAQLDGRNSVYLANYGVEQRGGVSLGFIQISDEKIGFPKFQYADIIIILTQRAIDRVKEYIKKDTIIIADETLVKNDSLKGTQDVIMIPALKLASDNLVPRVFNTIILGALGAILKIDSKSLKESVQSELSEKYKKSPELKHFNERALEIGRRTVLIEENIIG